MDELHGCDGSTDSRPVELFGTTNQANAAQNNHGRHDDVQIQGVSHEQDATQHSQAGHAQLNSGGHRGGKGGQDRIPEYAGKGRDDGA